MSGFRRSAHADDVMESTLAARRRPTKLQPRLKDAESVSMHREPADESEGRSGELRVVNGDRERLSSDASVPMDLQSSSSMPYAWSADDWRADQDRKARWEDSSETQNGRKSPIPSTFHGIAVDILVKIRLLPVMKTLLITTEKTDLLEALERAEAVLKYAVGGNASPALQGRCCYYIGVAMHLLDDNDAFKYFIGALDAKGVYEEGSWAKQWINHYESLAELSPNRLALSDKRISWTGSMKGYSNRNGHKHGVDAT